MATDVAPVDPREVSADNALVEIVRTRRPLACERLGDMLARWCADVDTTPIPEWSS